MRESDLSIRPARFVGRDRIALIGVVWWLFALGLFVYIILAGHLVNLGDLFEGSLTGFLNGLVDAFRVPSVPFLIGACFLLPRIWFLRRMLAAGRLVGGAILEKEDVTGRRGSGSRIVYGYEYQGRPYRATLRTWGIVPWLIAGESVAVLVDPERPARSMLTGAYKGEP